MLGGIVDPFPDKSIMTGQTLDRFNAKYDIVWTIRYRKFMSPLQVTPPRSMLFVSGERVERFPKAMAAGADLVCIDLEDAVHPERKAQARHDVPRLAARGMQAATRWRCASTR